MGVIFAANAAQKLSGGLRACKANLRPQSVAGWREDRLRAVADQQRASVVNGNFVRDGEAQPRASGAPRDRSRCSNGCITRAISGSGSPGPPSITWTCTRTGSRVAKHVELTITDPARVWARRQDHIDAEAATSHTLPDGQAAHSLATFLAELASLVSTTCRSPSAAADAPTCNVLTAATAVHRRAMAPIDKIRR